MDGRNNSLDQSYVSRHPWGCVKLHRFFTTGLISLHKNIWCRTRRKQRITENQLIGDVGLKRGYVPPCRSSAGGKGSWRIGGLIATGETLSATLIKLVERRDVVLMRQPLGTRARDLNSGS
jgi:hypothetical protein